MARSSLKCTSRSLGCAIGVAFPPSARALFAFAHAGLARGSGPVGHVRSHRSRPCRAPCTSRRFLGRFSSTAVVVSIERAKHLSLSCISRRLVSSHFMYSGCPANWLPDDISMPGDEEALGQTPCLSLRFSAVPLPHAVMPRSREQGMRLRRACTTLVRFTHTSLSPSRFVLALHQHAERWTWLTCQAEVFAATESRAVFKAADVGTSRSGLKLPY